MQQLLINLSLLLLIIINYINAYNIVSINLLLKKSMEDSLISFIKLPYIHNLKIKNHSNYLILNYLDIPKKKTNLNIQLLPNLIKITDINDKIINDIRINNDHYNELINDDDKRKTDSFLNIYDTIKNNKKQLVIINKNNKNNMNSKYLYLIKSKNEYLVRYTFDYNKKRYKYYFDIRATPVDKYETSWEISAKVTDYSVDKSLAMIGFYIKNWIENNIYNNNRYEDIQIIIIGGSIDNINIIINIYNILKNLKISKYIFKTHILKKNPLNRLKINTSNNSISFISDNDYYNCFGDDNSNHINNENYSSILKKI